MWRLTWRGIRAHLGRFILSMLAVLLGVAFLSSTLALRNVLFQTFQSAVTSSLVGDLYAIGKSDKPGIGVAATTSLPWRIETGAPISLDLVPVIENIDGVSHAVPSISGSAVLLDLKGVPVAIAGSPAVLTAVYPYPPGPHLLKGKLPEGSSEIMLDEGALERGGFKVGDITTMVVAGRPAKYEIVGVSSFGAPLSAVTQVYMDPEVLRPVYAASGAVPMVAIDVAASSDLDVVRERLQEAVGPEARIVTGADLRAQASEQITKVLGFVNTFMLVFVAISLVVGSFIVVNTFYMTVQARQRTFALLRAMGARQREILTMVTAQALVVGFIGSLLGVGAGIGLMLALQALMRAVGWNFGQEWAMTPTIIGVSLLVGTLATVLASLAPARAAAFTSPLEAIRQSSTLRERPLHWRTLIGLLGLAGGALLFTAALFPDKLSFARGHTLPFLGAGAALILLAALALSPLVGKVFFFILGAPAALVSPVLGRIAGQNLLRTPRRAASTAAALIIGMSLVSGGAVIASSVQASTAAMLKETFRADLIITALMPPSTTEPAVQVLQKVRGMGEIYDDLAMGQVSVVTPGGDPTTVTLGSASQRTIESVLPLQLRDGDLSSLSAGQALISTSLANQQGWKVGQAITLTGTRGIYSTKIGAIMEPSAYLVQVLVTPDVLRQVLPTSQAASGSILATVKDLDKYSGTQREEKLEKVRNSAQLALKPFYVYQVMNRSQFQDLTTSTINQVLGIIYALLSLSLLIAFLAILNTMGLSVAERFREIGLARALGVTEGGARRTILIEAAILGLYGSLMGVGIGLALSLGLRYYLRLDGLTTLSIPWGQIAGLVALSVLAAVIAAWIPAYRAGRQPMLEAISQD